MYNRIQVLSILLSNKCQLVLASADWQRLGIEGPNRRENHVLKNRRQGSTIIETQTGEMTHEVEGYAIWPRGPTPSGYLY